MSRDEEINVGTKLCPLLVPRSLLEDLQAERDAARGHAEETLAETVRRTQAEL